MYIIRVTRFESTEIILEPDILSLVPLHSSKYKTVKFGPTQIHIDIRHSL